MAYSEQARRYAVDTLEKRRFLCLQKTAEQRAQAIEKVPELEQLEAQISAIGLSSMRTILAQSEPGIAGAMKAQIDEIKQRERQLLSQNGFAEDYLDPLYCCAACGDSGITADGKTCDCVKKLLGEYARGEINKKSPLELCDFGSFSLNYYSEQTDDEMGVSARSNMKKVLDTCLRFASKFPGEKDNLLMTGDAGLGKTHLALSIASEVLKRGYDVVYCSAANVFRQIEIEHFENRRDTTTIDSLKQCDLLVLDDLGAEFVSPFVNSTLYDVVNTRILQRRPTVYTTNITKDDVLTMRYGEKTMSRLVGCSSVLPFFGDDIRIQKSNESD